jgi:predicted amidophosphoribosyltransferase
VLDLLLPRRCVACGATGSHLCDDCHVGLPRLRPPLCARCGAPTAWPVARCRECAGRRIAFASARAAVAYDADVRLLVAGWKDRGLRRLAAVAAGLVAETILPPEVLALTFVPADEDRAFWRGHHAPERLARELGRLWSLPVEPLLCRTRRLPRQRGLSLEERRRNVRAAFQAVGRSPARVALVDDVYTSGATVAAGASALRGAGARRVDVVTLARAIRTA